jgi:hypothetical protein
MRQLRLQYILWALFVPLMAGCGDLFDLDINTDPDAATEVEGDLLMPTVLANMASNRAIEISPGNAFHAQIWASNGSAGVFTDPERYIMSSFTVGNTWSNIYTTGLKNLTLMRDQALAQSPARNNVAAQAEIVASYQFWMATSLWETIPFTQALQGDEFPQPEFDDQETVLRGLLDKLDAAIALIDPAGSPGVQEGDLLYGGDMDDWIKFANSLKLRILMMIRNEDPSANAAIQALLTQPLIRTNAEEAAVPFFETANNENNLWRLNNLFGGFTDVQNGNAFVYAGEPLVELMKSLDDPRLNTYWEFAVDGDGEYQTSEYFGQTAGVFEFGDETSMVSQNIVRRAWPSRMITAAEVWFYEAEFLASSSGPAAAQAAYQTGVQRALDYFDGKPGAISAAAKAAYVASLPPATVTAIHDQQYIEVLDRSPENWVHWKRTHHPDLPLPQQAVLGDIIRRYPMPTAERSANPNIPDPVPLDRPMWFEPGN